MNSKPGPLLWLLLFTPAWVMAQQNPQVSQEAGQLNSLPQRADSHIQSAEGAQAQGADGSQTQGADGSQTQGADGSQVQGADGSQVQGAEGSQTQGAEGTQAQSVDAPQPLTLNSSNGQSDAAMNVGPNGLAVVKKSPVLSLQGQALVDYQAGQLLQAMSYAVRSIDYRGLLSYEHGSAMDTLRIVHKVHEGREYERVFHLNGMPAEYTSQGRSLDCQQAGDKILRGASLRLGDKLLKLADLYQFRIPGLQRIAGRPAFVLQAIPKDGKHRFGYNIAIDRQTGFPLMTEVVGARRTVMERFQFVDIEFDAHISDEELQAANPASLRVDARDCGQASALREQSWQASWLPQGFVFTGQKASQKGGDLLTFTDGLSSISVFVDQVRQDQLIEGRAIIGATVIYISKLKLDNKLYSITVVGEVPGLTAQKVGESVRPYMPSRAAVIESRPGDPS